MPGWEIVTLQMWRCTAQTCTDHIQGIAVHSHTWGLVEMVVDGGVSAYLWFVAVCVKLIMFKVTRLFMWVFINTENQRTSKEPAGTLDRQGT